MKMFTATIKLWKFDSDPFDSLSLTLRFGDDGQDLLIHCSFAVVVTMATILIVGRKP